GTERSTLCGRDHELRIHHACHRRKHNRELGLEKVDQTAVGPHRMLTEEKGVRAGAGVVAFVSLASTVPHELCVCEEPEPCRSRTNSRFARIATCMLCETHGRPHS